MTTAFQIADDVLDYTGNIAQTGKNIGDDLAEKKMTLPLIHAMKHADQSDALRLRQIIEQGDRERIVEVIEVLAKTDSVNYAKNLAFAQAERAKSALSDFPDSAYKAALLRLADMAVRRNT